jgi:hypothetical protein
MTSPLMCLAAGGASALPVLEWVGRVRAALGEG